MIYIYMFSFFPLSFQKCNKLDEYTYTSISTRATHERTNIFRGVNKLLL